MSRLVAPNQVTRYQVVVTIGTSRLQQVVILDFIGVDRYPNDVTSYIKNWAQLHGYVLIGHQKVH